MVKEQLKTLMLWVIAVVVLLQTAQCHIVQTLWSEHQKEISRKSNEANSVLTAEEVDDFMLLWPQYKDLNLKALPSKSLSVAGKQTIDWKTKIWFVYHRQDIERFFYVQQRLAELLRQIDIKRNAVAVIKQMNGRQDELSSDMAQQYQRRLNAIQIDEKEIEIIMEREEALKQLFRLYPA